MFMKILFVYLNVLFKTRLFYFNCEHFLFVYIVNKNKQKIFTDFIKNNRGFPRVTWGTTHNLGPIGSAVLTFIGYKRTDRKAKYIYIYVSIFCLFMLYMVVADADLYIFLTKIAKKISANTIQGKIQKSATSNSLGCSKFFITSDPPWRINLTPSWYNDQ